MNLQALRENIKNLLDYSPELQAFNDQVDELTNEAYLHIWTYKRWNFAQKQELFKFLPDITGTRDTSGAAITASVTQTSRNVTFSAGMERLTYEWEGQPIEIQGYEYIISKVISTSSILLKEQFHGTTEAADTTWKIKHRYYDLPEDCMELLSLAHRDTPVPGSGTSVYGKLIALLARREETYNLDIDRTSSYAEGFVWSAPHFVPPAEKTTITNITKRTTDTSDGFPEETYLEVCWAFERNGHIGALSEPARVQIPQDPNAVSTYTFDINFVSWDDQAIVADGFQSFDTQPAQYEGYRKVVFWNANYNRSTGERLGIPCWLRFNEGGTTRNTETYLDTVKALDTDSSVTIEWFNQIDPGNARYKEYDGQHLRIRPYPRVDAWDVAVPSVASAMNKPSMKQDYLRYGVMRYQYKPTVLSKATDSPEMPYEFHQLIVYRALEQVYLKIGQPSMSDIYRKRIEDAMKDLQKRYLDRIDSSIIRGQFNIGDGRFFGNIKNVTYLG